jgi:putative transposase
MRKRAKYSNAEIAAKLRKADDMATQGKLQSEIARTLGVSIMTLHRWRKMSLASRAAPAGLNDASQLKSGPDAQIAELRLENSRLRGLVADLLLEKVKLEEALRLK